MPWKRPVSAAPAGGVEAGRYPPFPGFSMVSVIRRDRRLGWALVLSLAAHGLVLSPAPLFPKADGGAPLQATLRQPPAAMRESAPETPTAPPARTPPPRHTQPDPARHADEKLPPPLPAAAPSPIPSDRPSETATAAASPVSQSGGPAVAAAAANAAPQPPRPGVDANGLRQYHLALGRAAARFKRYPAQAREAGWEGRVTLRLEISEAGAPVGLAVAGSSGFPVLDRAAQEMMRLAADRTPVPDSLRGRAFAIDLPVDYSLKDEPW